MQFLTSKLQRAKLQILQMELRDSFMRSTDNLNYVMFRKHIARNLEKRLLYKDASEKIFGKRILPKY